MKNSHQRIAIGVVKNNTGQYLVAKRNAGVHLENYWEFPGGKVEQYESFKIALRRELQEEIGIQPCRMQKFFEFRHKYDDRSLHFQVFKIVTYDLAVRSCDGQQLKWVEKHQLENINMPLANRAIVTALKLPKSYKEFLRITNGFKQISLFAGHLLPVQEIGWLKNLVPDLYEVYELEEFEVSNEDYFNYSDSQDSVKFRVEYLLNSIVVSKDVEGSIILLNPQIKFENEWEAWLYASWYPGASRFKSFKELIYEEFKSTERLIKEK